MMRQIERHKAGITFGVLFLAGIGLHYWRSEWPPDWSWLGAIRNPLADSLMVAGILGGTVDSFLKAALIRDVGSIFIGWALPQQIRDYIREVSQTSIVRENRRLDISFTVINGEVLMDVTDECDVYNYSTGMRRYRSVMGIDAVENPDHSAMRFELTQADHTTSFDASDFGTKHKTNEKHSVHWRSPKESWLWPQDVNDAGKKPGCSTRWKYQLRLPLNYTTIAAVALPTLGMRVTIHAPIGLTAFCKATDDCIHADGSNVWQFRRLYMPDQHIRLYWYPEEPSRYRATCVQEADDFFEALHT